MKTTFQILALAIAVTFSSCDNSKKIDLKYAENPKLLACEFPSGDLYKEAVYAFENDMVNQFDKQTKNTARAYVSFITDKSRGRTKVEMYASEHSWKIAQELKKESDLWIDANGHASLNPSNALLDCIANNIRDNSIKTSFNSLLATNSLRHNVVLPLLSSNSRTIQADGSLKTYLALEFFFAELQKLPFEALKNPNPKAPIAPTKPAVNGVNLNKTPSKQPVKVEEKKDPHAGHNHD